MSFSIMYCPFPDASPPLFIHRSLLPCVQPQHIYHLYHTKKDQVHQSTLVAGAKTCQGAHRRGMQDEKCYRNAVLMKYVSKGKRGPPYHRQDRLFTRTIREGSTACRGFIARRKSFGGDWTVCSELHPSPVSSLADSSNSRSRHNLHFTKQHYSVHASPRHPHPSPCLSKPPSQ